VILNSEVVNRVIGKKIKEEKECGKEEGNAVKKKDRVLKKVCGTRPGICSPTDQIDAAWHEFVLYTQDYAAFCNDMFGRFIHHIPQTYLSDKNLSKGKTWRTFQVAQSIFDNLSPNWNIPEHMRPYYGPKGKNVKILKFDNCGDSCGCGPACNND